MSLEKYKLSVTAEMDLEAIESLYSEISTKFSDITIKPSIDMSVLENGLANIANTFTSILGFLELGSKFKSKSASKEIEEISKKCQDTYKTIGKYRDILLGVATAFETTGKNARNAKQDLNRISDTYRAMGTYIGKGLNEGIKDTFKNLEKTMKDLGETMEDALKKKMDINSPSKVFAKIGESVTEGLVDGIKEGSEDVTDTMKGLGDDMESSFGEKALSFGGGFALAAGILGTIVEMFSNLMETNEEFGAAVDAVWSQITEAFTPVTEAVMNLITSLGEEGMGGSFSWFSDALTGVSELAVSVIGTIGEFWAEHGEAIMLSVGEIWDLISGILSGAIDFVGGVFEVISGIFSGNAEDIQSGMAKLWEVIQNIFAPVVGFFAGIWERIKESFGTIGQTVADSISGAFKGTVNAVIRFAENTINGFIRAINRAIRLINEIPGVSVSLLSTISIPKLALGGMVMPGQLFIAREAGPELVGSFGSRSAVMNNNQIVESVSRGVAMANMTEAAILREVRDLLKVVASRPNKVQIGEREFGEVVVGALNRRTYELGDSGLMF